MKLARLAALSLAVVACHREAPPPPPALTSGSSAGSGSAAPPDAAPDAVIVEPTFRTANSTDHVESGVVGVGKTFVVASAAKEASQVGKDVLASGGNAVDAAVAVAFALAVVHPTAGNLAGGGFAVVRVARAKVVALDFREVAPAAAKADMYIGPDGKPTKASLFGDLAVGVPGSVAGLWALHGKLGKKPWKELVEPAIKLARDGFVVDKYLNAAIVRAADTLLQNKATGALWVPGRIPRPVGSTVTLPELAVALERIRDQGPDGFYKGDTAAAIVAEMKTGGGIITAADLAAYKPEWREPLAFAYRGHTLYSMPPPSSGGIVLAMTALMLSKVDLGKLPWHGPEHIHWLVEVWRRAFAARNEVLGDPAYVKDMPVAKLTSPEYAAQLEATITDRATPSKDIPALLEGNHTTNLCVVDGAGMAVALTTTLNTGWGNRVTVNGFLLNNEMDDFTAKPGSPNVFGLVQGTLNKIEPGKRMLSSMSPTVVEDDKGDVVMVAGAGGGPRIITAVWQTISNVLDFGDTLPQAVALPRIHHQHLPDKVFVEPDGITKETNAALVKMGYVLDHTQQARDFADVSAVLKTSDGWAGTADAHGGGAAMGD